MDELDEILEGIDSDEEELLTPEEENISEVQAEPIPSSPVEAQFSEFESNSTGDPFRAIQSASRKFGEKFKGLQEGTGGLYDPSAEADKLFSGLANRVVSSASQIDSRTNTLSNTSISQSLDGFRPNNAGQIGSSNISTGFIGRAGISEFRNLISQPGRLQGSFFQLQQQEIVSSLSQRRDSFTLVNQKLTFSDPTNSVISNINARATSSILSGNELTAKVGEAIQRRDNLTANPVMQIRSFASFHPKIGFVGDREAGGVAFIGTQNITPALKGNNSLETMMSFSMLPGSKNLSTDVSLAAQTESGIATEILEMTEAITGMVTPGYVYKPGGIQAELKKRGIKRSLLYVESEIYGRVSKALHIAAFDDRSVTARDKVVVSMGEISLLLKKNGYSQEMVSSLKKLASERRLSIVTDQRRLTEVLDAYRGEKSSSSMRVNTDLFQTLIQQGAIRTAATGYQHDKTIAIFGESGRNLKFLATGSANLSADSMLPVGMIPEYTNEYFQTGVQALRRTFTEDEYDTASPINADTVLALGFGQYGDKNRDIARGGVKEYLGKLDRDGSVARHYNDVAGGFLYSSINKPSELKFNSGFITERNSDEKKVKELKKAIEELGKKLGSSIEVEGRYDLNQQGLSGLAKLSGITVRVKDVDGLSSRSAKLHLTVNSEGNVVVSDSNKVITGSVFMNKSFQPMNVVGKNVRSGSSINLSSLETAIGLIGTISREMSYNTRFSSVGDVFNNYASRNRLEVEGIARDLLAERIHRVVPELVNNGSNEGIHLSNIVRAIRTPEEYGLSIEASNVLDQVGLALELGQGGPMNEFVGSLNGKERDIRSRLVNDLIGLLQDNHKDTPKQKSRGAGKFEIFEDLVSKLVSDATGNDSALLTYDQRERSILGQEYGAYKSGTMLAQALQQDELGVFNDLKYEILNRSVSGSRALAETQSAQAGRLVSDLLAPYLAAHELGHAADQAQHRKPIYAETSLHKGDTAYDRSIRAGILNPATITAGTKVGTPGQYISLVGSNAHGKKLKTVGYGAVRQMTIVDSDISEGAAIKFDTEAVFRSTSGLGVITPDSYLSETRAALGLMGLQLGDDSELKKLLEEEEIDLITENVYLMPFNKPEQIPQRLKNLLGGRPTIDINKTLARDVMNLNASLNISNAGDITSGRIRESLPAAQFERLKEITKLYDGDESRVLEHFRRESLNPESTLHGVVGPTSMKKVLMMGGFSLMGDSSYLNADYEQTVGHVHRMTVPLSAGSMNDQTKVIGKVTEYLRRGNILITSPSRNEGSAEAEARATQLEKLHKGTSLIELQSILESDSSGKYSNYFLKQEGSSLKAYLKEGLYSLDSEKGQYTRIGQFTKDGLITVEGASTYVDTPWGRRSQPINIKFPGFGKRHESGASIISTTPYVNQSNGKISITTDVIPMWKAGTDSRPVGMGLNKGPMEVVGGDIFDIAHRMMDSRATLDTSGTYSSLTPDSLKREKIYGLFSPGHFKGFNFESGLFLLSQENSRAGLKGLSGDTVARSLSLLFLSGGPDSDISSALKDHLRSSGLGFAANAFIQASKHTKDFSNKEKSLGTIARGLASLADGETARTAVLNGDLSPLKQTVIKALRGDIDSINTLSSQANKLIDTVVDDPTNAIKYSDGRLGSLNESSSIVRGAGILAHTAFITSQLTAIKPGQSTGSMFQLDLGNVDRYFDDVGYRTQVDAVAAQAGIPMPSMAISSDSYKEEVKDRLALLQAYNANEVTLLDYKDTTISKSLVAAGMQDTVSLEYQYMLGLSREYLRAFEGAGGGSEKSKALQNAFGIIASAGKSIGGIDPDSFMGYQIALTSDKQGFMSHQEIEAQKLILSYTDLGDNLGIFDRAIEGLASKNSTDLDSLQLAQSIATASLDKGEQHFNERAVTLNRTHGLLYFSDQNDLTGEIQKDRLKSELGISEHSALHRNSQSLSPQEMVKQIVVSSYENYIQDRNTSISLGRETIGYSQYVEETGGAIKGLQDKYQLVSELTKGGDRISGTTFSMDRQVLNKKIGAQLSKLNELAMSSIRQTYNTEAESDLLKGSLEAETILERKVLDQINNNTDTTNNRYSTLLSEIKNTKQIVLPKIMGQPIMEGDDAGRFATRVLRPEDAAPAQGILLGSDILRNVALKFPGHIDDVLKHQRSLREQLISTEDLRGRIYNNGGKAIVSAEENEQLMTLESTLEASRLSFVRLADTDVVRKAFGDKVDYQGAVGFAIGSFAVSPTEVGIGDRFLSVTEQSQAARTVSNQFKSLKRLADTSEGVRALDATKMLVEAVGLKGPVTTREESNSGIASKATVLAAFEEVKNKAANGRIDRTDINNIENLALSSLANVSTERVQELKAGDRHTLDRLINTNLGSLRRGGAPAGVSGTINENLISETVHVSEVGERIRRDGGKLIPDVTRSKTAMFAPMVGRQLTMLGDFDGDAYQLLMTGTGDHLDRVNAIQSDIDTSAKTLVSLEANKKRLEHIGAELGTVESVQERIEQQRSKLTVKQDELVQELSVFSERSLKYDRTQLDALDDVRQWVGSHLSLPDYIVEDSSISTGQMMTFVTQMSGILGHVEDTSPYIVNTQERLGLIKSLFDPTEGFQFTQQALDSSNDNINRFIESAKTKGFRGDDDSLKYDLQGIFEQAKLNNVNSLDEFIDTSRNYLALQGNLASTIYSTNKSFAKAAGTALNAMDFEGLQSTIGQAGTDLIGKVYNSFIPLLDRAMGEHSIATAMNVSGEGSFTDIMGTRLESMIQDSSLSSDKKEAAFQLKNKLIDQRTQTIQRAEKKLAGTTGTLGALQQLIRDALKEKSDKGMVGMLQEATFEGKTLVEAMESINERDPVKADRARLNLLQQTVSTRIGPDLTTLDKGQAGLTGFGALIEFASISSTKDEDIYKRFIEDKGLENEFDNANKNQKTNIVSPLEFALDRTLTMIEQTQAVFKASNYTDAGKKEIVDRLVTRSNSNVVAKNSFELQQLEAARSFQQNEISQDELLQRTTLAEVQRTNREFGVLSVERLKELRNIYGESQNLRYGEGSIEQRASNMKIETNNAVIRMFQRGQAPSSADSMYMMGAQLNVLSQSLENEGVDTRGIPNNQLGEASKIMGFSFGDTPEERAVFTEALFTGGADTAKAYESLKESTSVMTKTLGIFEQIHSENSNKKPDSRRVSVLTDMLSSIMEGGRPKLDKYQKLRAHLGTQSNTVQQSELNADLERLTLRPFGRNTTENQNRARKTSTLLDPDANLEAVGAFAVPALMIALGSGAKLDERVGLAALDTFQSLAYLGTNSDRRTTDFMGDSSQKADFRYTAARVRDSMEQEGLVGGALQSVVQESLFRGGSQVVYKAIDAINNRLGTNKRKAGNTVATIAAETLSTVAALSFARSRSGARTDEGTRTPDRITDILRAFSDEVWKNVEKAQMALSDPAYEVVDTEINQNFDFDLNAVPSELEQDMLTGLIVLDEEDNNITPSGFDSSESEYAELVSSF